MLYILVIGIVLSALIGIISGLIPGLHINNTIYLISNINVASEIKAIIFIISSIIFSFLSILPSTILSIPNSENYTAVLPSQKLTLNGKAYYAIHLYLTGVINAIIFGIPILIILFLLIDYINSTIQILTPIILIIGIIILLFNIKNNYGLIIILFSSAIGYFSLSFANITNPLLVIISGLFGMSNILYLLQNKIIIPKQNLIIDNINLKTKIKIGIISPLLSFLVSLFPGLGNGFASYFGSKVMQLKDEGYILLNGAINVSVMIISFFMILFLEKSRTASALFLKDFAQNTFVFSFHWIIVFSIIGITFGYFITIYLSKFFVLRIHKFNYKIINITIIIFLNIIVILFSNYLGFIVFWICSIIGYICIKTNNPRILMMSSIIVPVLFYFI